VSDVSASSGRSATATIRSQIATFRADSLFRTATPLLLNTVATAVLGILYWIVAARLYSPSNLALASAAVAAMVTLSGIAQLNMGLGLGVLLPRAGRMAGRLLTEVYGVVTILGVVLVIAFLLLLLPFVDSLKAMLTNPAIILTFAVGVLFYNIFALQDSALTALRAAKWVPVENITFGVAKIVVVVALASLLPRTGIFISWAAPAALMVIPVTFLLFRLVRRSSGIEPMGAVSLRQALRLPAAGRFHGRSPRRGCHPDRRRPRSSLLRRVANSNPPRCSGRQPRRGSNRRGISRRHAQQAPPLRGDAWPTDGGPGGSSHLHRRSMAVGAVWR
jgi:hypothetical protein